MKLLLSISFSILMTFCYTLSAQDTLIFISGKEVIAKVMTVSKSIRYKKYTNPDGPTYTVSKDEVYKITYTNGDVDFFNKTKKKKAKSSSSARKNYLSIRGTEYYEGYKVISKEDFITKFKSVPEAYQLYEKGVKQAKIGLTVGGIGFIIVVAGMATSTKEGPNVPLTGLGATAALVGLFVGANGGSKVKKAFNLYNISKGNPVGITIGQNGLGFVMTF